MALIKTMPAPAFKVQTANGKIVPVSRQSLFRFSIADKQFEETFKLLPTMGNILIGMSTFKQNSVTLDFQNHVIQFPDVSLQHRKANGKYNCNMCELRTAQNVVLPPYQQIIVSVSTNVKSATITGTAAATPTITRNEALWATSTVVELENGYTNQQVTNPHDHIYTINAGGTPANLTVLSPNQAKHIKPFAPEHLSLLRHHPDDATALTNHLLYDEPTTTIRNWYPTSETCHDPQTLSPMERRIYDARDNLRQQEKLLPRTFD